MNSDAFFNHMRELMTGNPWANKKLVAKPELTERVVNTDARQHEVIILTPSDRGAIFNLFDICDERRNVSQSLAVRQMMGQMQSDLLAFLNHYTKEQ